MKNEWGIDVQSTIQPTKRMDYSKWCEKFRFGQGYIKPNEEHFQNNQYTFIKLKQQFNEQKREGVESPKD